MDDDLYFQYLQRARTMLPTLTKQVSLDIPTVKVSTEGNKTQVINWRSIVKYINRDPTHIAKFVAKQRSSAATIEGDGKYLIFPTKVSPRTLDNDLKLYARTFVVCKVCGSRNTNLEKSGRLTMMVCSDCGAKSAVK
ncbi:MAG: hypothetical protein ACFFBD_03160 [Candidatus Hodarchaeota archaeon]